VQRDEEGKQEPFLVTYGVDTLYVNVLAEELPTWLIAKLTYYKDLALANNDTATTPWLYAGIPLNMHKTGKGTTGKRGVSWGYILRNSLIEVKLRKAHLQGIVGMVRLGAEPLWKHTPHKALDLMQSMLQSMWLDTKAFKEVRLQVSQAHLCADIANFALSPDLLGKIVSRSLSQVIHVPTDDEEASDAAIGHFADDDDLYDYLYNEVAYEELHPDVDEGVWEDDDDNQDDMEDDDQEDDNDANDDEPPAWASAGAQFHLFGKSVQGFTFSPKAPLSAAWYNKVRELRHQDKAWMRAIHEAGGWQDGMDLTRIEPRFTRPVFREIAASLPPEQRAWCEDPYLLLEHQGDLWGVYAGIPPEADTAPDVFPRGWMRLAAPTPHDATKQRWPNHPVWDIVQRVPFNARLPRPLQRSATKDPYLDKLYAEAYGMLITIAMLRGSYLHVPAELPRELEALEDWADGWQEQRALPFADAVRERARMLGKALPLDMIPPLPTRGRPRKELA
jgi:hypothetical protein